MPCARDSHLPAGQEKLRRPLREWHLFTPNKCSTQFFLHLPVHLGRRRHDSRSHYTGAEAHWQAHLQAHLSAGRGAGRGAGAAQEPSHVGLARGQGENHPLVPACAPPPPGYMYGGDDRATPWQRMAYIARWARSILDRRTHRARTGPHVPHRQLGRPHHRAHPRAPSRDDPASRSPVPPSGGLLGSGAKGGAQSWPRFWSMTGPGRDTRHPCGSLRRTARDDTFRVR